jgi:hypothetical protein
VAGNPVNDRMIDIQRIVEKPAPEDAPSRLGVAGRYILTPGVFHEIMNQPRGVGGEIQLTDGIAGLLRREKVFAYRYEGKRYDCGSKEGFLQANVELALAHPLLGPGFRGSCAASSCSLHRARRAANRLNSIGRPQSSAPPQVVRELGFGAGLLDQFVAGLAREGLKVAYRPGVGGHDLQHLAAGHVGQGFLGLEDRQRAFRPRVSVFVASIV